jgi:hypothetical protein
MARPRVYPHEFRERSVRVLREWREARGVGEGGLRAVCKQLNLATYEPDGLTTQRLMRTVMPSILGRHGVRAVCVDLFPWNTSRPRVLASPYPPSAGTSRDGPIVPPTRSCAAVGLSTINRC